MARKKKGKSDLSLSGGTPRGLKASTGVRAPSPRGQTTRAATKAPKVVGRPGVTALKQSFPRVLKPVWARQGIKTLIKKDLSKGLSLPDAETLPGQAGVVNNTSGGYRGARVITQHPAVPARSGRNQRVVKAPSPTSGAGVRSPFNAKTRVGRKGSNKRFGG